MMTVITVRQICGITLYMNIKLYIILKQTIPLRHVFFCDVTQRVSRCVAFFSFLRSWDRASLMYSSKTNKTQCYTTVFITIMLCMFQAVPLPIIRSPKLYTQHRVFVELFLLLSSKKQKKLDKYLMLCIQLWAPDDGRRNRLKHLQHYRNKYHCVTLCLVGLCWNTLCSNVLGQLVSPIFKCQAVQEECQAIGGHIIIHRIWSGR